MKNKKGFTILEVVVAISLFALLYAGLFNAIFLGMRMQPILRTRIFAHNIINAQSEFFKSLPVNDSLLKNDADNGDADDIENPDFVDTIRYATIGNVNYDYLVMWNIVDNFPSQDMFLIRLFVRDLRHPDLIISNDIVRWREE